MTGNLIEPTPGRCPSMHNPGVWPYTARCIRPAGHETDGSEWAVRDVPADESTTRLALPDEHCDHKGGIWQSVFCPFLADDCTAECPSVRERACVNGLEDE
jgi:hypothetical protein